MELSDFGVRTTSNLPLIKDVRLTPNGVHLRPSFSYFFSECASSAILLSLFASPEVGSAEMQLSDFQRFAVMSLILVWMTFHFLYNNS